MEIIVAITSFTDSAILNVRKCMARFFSRNAEGVCSEILPKHGNVT